jgi:hypothetical protein
VGLERVLEGCVVLVLCEAVCVAIVITFHSVVSQPSLQEIVAY